VRAAAIVALAALLAAGATGGPASAQDGPTPVDPAMYLTIFDDADLRGVTRPDDEIYRTLIDITGDPAVDARIRAAAEARGYEFRPLADVELVAVDGFALQPAVADAWTAMRDAARRDGVGLSLTSGHRDVADQQWLFLRRLGGDTSDAGIERTLRTSAPPGYSKHHSGHAIDVGQAGAERTGFAGTAAHRWLSEYDFARAKAFGFVPSYPPGGETMGPDPETWEFVWVGPGRIGCATGAEVVAGFCDIADNPRAADIVWLAEAGVTVGCAPGRYCPDDPLTRGEAASLLWRLHGAPTVAVAAPFADVYPQDHFHDAVVWLWANGIVEGTSDATFSPDGFLTPVEALTILLRLDAAALPVAGGLFPGAPWPAVSVPVGDLGHQIDRAEFASVLRAAATG
jgi:hypothetical protein